MELIEKLGLDLTLFIAQIVNFLIVLGVLYAFVYKPVIKILENRKKIIKKSLEDAKKIEEQLAKSQKEAQEILNEARIEAQETVQLAMSEGQKQREDLVENTKKELSQMSDKHKKQLEIKKEEMMHEIQSEVVDLTVYAMMQSLDKDITSEIDKKYITKVLKDV